jgi:hypothetical protein
MRAAAIAALSLCGVAAIAQDSAQGSKSAAAEPGRTTGATAATVKATADAKAFKLPPGFYEKKRGKHMLYCKKDAPMGTRIQTERCMNDGQMRDYLIALQEQKTNVDRLRAICSNPAICRVE